MAKHDPYLEAAAPIPLDEENALLRASLAEAQRRIQELERSADGDSLTPLPSAFRFRTELERVTGLAQRHGTPAAVVSIVLDGVEAIGERHGHFAVDAVLVHVARLLCGLIRSTDILARTGEAEFGLILDHLDHNSAIDTAERLERCIAENPLDLGHARVKVEATVATTAIMPGDSADQVLEHAQRNLAAVRNGF
jgi:diguanylate cyclase (GGDEF)-like protein